MKRVTTLFAVVLFLLSSSSITAQIPNNGFENWATDANNDTNPLGWSTTNSDPDVSVTQYTPAYAGNYSMKVSTFDPGFMYIGGVAEISFPFTQRPGSFSACIKANVMAGDKVYIIVSMFLGDSIIASPGDCSFVIDSSINNFTCLSFPITYQSALFPDSASIMIVAGGTAAQAGTEIIVDELSFGSPSDITIMSASKSLQSLVYPNPASDFSNISVELDKESSLTVFISDSRGVLVKKMSYSDLAAGKHDLLLNTCGLAEGMYYYSVNGNNFSVRGKFAVCR